MRFSVWPNMNQPWEDVLRIVRHAEATGWDGCWYADHFMPNAEDISTPTDECFTTLAALAASVPRLRFGSLVAGNTYRHPAVLAKMAVTIDHISGGRFILGIGAGWQENEHTAYGIDFFDVPARLRRLDEACKVITGLVEGERTDFDGNAYQLRQAPLEPKPTAGHLPLLIGGGGEKVTLRIAATYADEWNVWGTPELLRQKGEVLAGHCERIGRDPSSIAHSAQALLFLSNDTAFLDKIRGRDVGRPVILGTPTEVVDIIGAYAAAGVDEIIIPDFTMNTWERKQDALDLFITEVAPTFREVQP